MSPLAQFSFDGQCAALAAAVQLIRQMCDLRKNRFCSRSNGSEWLCPSQQCVCPRWRRYRKHICHDAILAYAAVNEVEALAVTALGVATTLLLNGVAVAQCIWGACNLRLGTGARNTV